MEAAVIGGLLLFNAALCYWQEGRAQKALQLLRQQLRVLARVRRDGAWVTLRGPEKGAGSGLRSPASPQIRPALPGHGQVLGLMVLMCS